MVRSNTRYETGMRLDDRAADLVDEDVVLGQVCMHEAALLIQLANQQHQLRIEGLLCLQRDLRILHRSLTVSLNTFRNTLRIVLDQGYIISSARSACTCRRGILDSMACSLKGQKEEPSRCQSCSSAEAACRASCRSKWRQSSCCRLFSGSDVALSTEELTRSHVRQDLGVMASMCRK